MKLIGTTLDDLVRDSIEAVLASDSRISSRSGDNQEILGAYLELTNPRARLCQAENKSTLYSCFGELLWYLSGSDDIAFMQYYVPDYANYVTVVGERVPTAYGPRMFSWDGMNQIETVTERLRSHPDTRQATLQIFDRKDLITGQQSVPCTCMLQFICRERRLHLITTMRSNDVFRGLPTDAFAFTMLQELVARSLGVELGTYRHFAGSLHIYAKDVEGAKRLVEEGWQQTVGASMEPMPDGDPWPAIKEVLRAERAYRNEGFVDPWPSMGHGYWDQIVWLLEMHCHFKRADLTRFEAGMARSRNAYFDRYIESRLKQLQGR
jgi:thymidylate synthase